MPKAAILTDIITLDVKWSTRIQTILPFKYQKIIKWFEANEEAKKQFSLIAA